MKVKIVIDNQDSWMNDYLGELKKSIVNEGYTFVFSNDYEDNVKVDFTFFLSCHKKIKEDYLELSDENFVIHESDLPKGRGWSPLTYQIIEGKSNIKISLIKVSSHFDSGDICLQLEMEFDGYELVEELRQIQFSYSLNLVLQYLKNHNNIVCRKQTGDSTYYKKRLQSDSELDISKTIEEQFNLLRTVDNDRYPAFFNIDGKKYLIKIFKADDSK